MKFPRVADLIEAVTGFEPELVRSSAVEQLIVDRMRRSGATDEAAYLETLRREADELERLAEGIAVPETSLFRYPDSFELLSARLSDRLARADGSAVLRMASVGCATGEESCSMAITAAAAGWPTARIQIDAFDRSERALRQARSGCYRATAAARAPDWAGPWLEADRERVRVSPALVQRIGYRRVDALRLPVPQPAGYDVIFCRNLLIYLSAESRRQLVRWLVAALAPHGVLFVGHAEHGPALASPAVVPVGAPRCFAFVRAPAERASPTRRPAAPAVPARRPAAVRRAVTTGAFRDTV
ncbi:MAG: CheR family methyltransferase, partial [Planctomycetota bacterium]